MRILVLSDNHYKEISPDLKYDYIIHCGDHGSYLGVLNTLNAHYVKGNCDFSGPKELIIDINNKKIYITHGDMYNVKMSYNSICYKALSVNADICMFGHTHNQKAFYVENILFLNPGSYMNGDYIEIIDEDILFYKDNILVDKLVFRW